MATSDYKNGLSATNVAASATIGPFTLLGGRYGMVLSDTGTANASLKIMSPDGQFVPVGASTTFSAAGYATIDLPAGTFQIVFGSGITLGAVSFVPIPYRPN